MKTKDYLFVLGAVIAVHGVGAQNVADFFENGQGSGTPEDPYVITTADQLNAMRYGGENKCYRLDADIDLGTWITENENVDIREHGWVSIDVFRQILDGNGHKIEGFWQNRETDGGLFFQLQVENVDIPTHIKDLIIEIDPEKGLVTGGQTGILATKVNKEASTVPVTITNCHMKGNISSTGQAVGGLVGRVEAWLEIDSCSFQGKIIGGAKTGGLVGQKYEGRALFTMKHSYTVDVDVVGNEQTGGLGGDIGPNSLIESCYASGGTVTGASSVGGLVGLWGSKANVGNCVRPSQIMRCFASNAVLGHGTIGGLVGEMRISSGGEANPDAEERAQAFDIVQCYSAGSVNNGDGHIAGGLIGQYVGNKETLMEECYSIVSVVSNPAIGGLVGDANECLGLHIKNCVALNGSFTADELYDTGAILGKQGNGMVTMTNCSVLDSLEAFANGATLLSKWQATQQGSYTGWDFDKVWTFGNGGYKLPVLTELANQPTQVPEHLYVESGTTGYSMAEAAIPRYYVKERSIVVEGGSGIVTLYDASGSKLCSATYEGNLNWSIGEVGMYILQINGNAYKLLIR